MYHISHAEDVHTFKSIIDVSIISESQVKRFFVKVEGCNAVSCEESLRERASLFFSVGPFLSVYFSHERHT